MKKNERYFWVALLVLMMVGARQAYTLIEYPPTKSGLVCVGAPAPFDCEPAPPTGGAVGTASPTLARTPTPTVTRTSLPSHTPTPGLPRNLLVNGDFEMADCLSGWTFINLWRDTPSVNCERGDPRTRFDGAQSVRFWNNFRCVAIALRQAVVVDPGTYELTAWARTWQSDGTFPDGQDPNAFDYGQVGIDPNGNLSLTSGIIWSRQDDVDEGAQITIRVNITSRRTITVFVVGDNGVPDWSGTACQWPHTHIQVYLDGARLTIAGAEPAAIGPQVSGQVVPGTPPTPTLEPPPTEQLPTPYPIATPYP